MFPQIRKADFSKLDFFNADLYILVAIVLYKKMDVDPSKGKKPGSNNWGPDSSRNVIVEAAKLGITASIRDNDSRLEILEKNLGTGRPLKAINTHIKEMWAIVRSVAYAYSTDPDHAAINDPYIEQPKAVRVVESPDGTKKKIACDVNSDEFITEFKLHTKAHYGWLLLNKAKVKGFVSSWWDEATYFETSFQVWKHDVKAAIDETKSKEVSINNMICY